MMTMVFKRNSKVIEHWGQPSYVSLPSIYFPTMTSRIRSSISRLTPTVKKADVFMKNTQPYITMSNDVNLNTLNVQNELKIGDFKVAKDTNSNLIIGSSNIGIDINKNTIFKKPVLINEEVSEITMNDISFVDGRTHMYGDLLVNNKFCFLNSNDNNCLLKDDVEYMYYSSNYIDKAKVALSACISRNGLQTATDDYLEENNIDIVSGSNTNELNQMKRSKNIPLDDEMVCIGKKDTMRLLDNWALVSTEMKQTSVQKDDVPTNICSKDDIKKTKVFTYNGNTYNDESEIETAIIQNECSDIWNSCAISTNYNHEIRFENNGTSDCDFQDLTTILGNQTYSCPGTFHCRKDCQGSNQKTSHEVCYELSSTDLIQNKEIKVSKKDTLLYLEKDSDHELRLKSGQKVFNLVAYGSGLAFERKGEYTGWDGGGVWRHSKEVANIAQFSIFSDKDNVVNNKHFQVLLKINNNGQWLKANDDNSLGMSVNPESRWELHIQ